MVATLAYRSSGYAGSQSYHLAGPLRIGQRSRRKTKAAMCGGTHGGYYTEDRATVVEAIVAALACYVKGTTVPLAHI